MKRQRKNSYVLLITLTLTLFCSVAFSIAVPEFQVELTDTAKINALNNEAYNTARKNPKQSIIDGHKALAISKNRNYKKGIADANLAIAAAFLAKYNPNDSATFYYLKALNEFTLQNNLKGMARACFGLSYTYNFKGQPNKALEFGTRSVKYFEQTASQREVITALEAVIFLEKQNDNFEIALELSDKAIHVARSLNDTLQWANALNNRGNIYKDMFLLNQAIDAYFEAFQLWEEKKDSTGIAIAFGSVANAYFYQEDFAKSLEYNLKKLAIIQHSNNLWETSKTLNNIALSYSNLNQHHKALQYMRRSLSTAKEINYPNEIANSCNHLSSTFLKMEQPDSALFYSLTAVDISRNNNQKTLPKYLVNLSNAFQKQHDYEQALNAAKEAHQLSKAHNNQHAQLAAAFALSQIYYLQKRKDLAYPFLTEYLKLNDSIANKTLMRKVTRLDIQHEFDKKERAAQHEIEMLDKTNQLKTERLRKTWIIFIALLLLSAAGAAISLLILRNKNHKIAQMSLELQNLILHTAKKQQLQQKKKKQHLIETYTDNYGLTQREAEILEQISKGLQNNQIAEKLFVSENTVKFHIKNIYIKLDVKNRIQALQKTMV